MEAMCLHRLAPLDQVNEPLVWQQRPDPVHGADEVLLRVTACGVCHTELDEIEGRTPPPRLPVIPGHQVVGRVLAIGDAVTHCRSATASVSAGSGVRRVRRTRTSAIVSSPPAATSTAATRRT